ncbi:hypothetical protein GCM10022295_91590 [Streptomyces osmaniensis]|uniref:Uncharacterized protein n=1 Tax=Streptomyces osmaniensis TaxID=593134 RepID=A0ABP6Z1C3_9ACTN
MITGLTSRQASPERKLFWGDTDEKDAPVVSDAVGDGGSAAWARGPVSSAAKSSMTAVTSIG